MQIIITMKAPHIRSLRSLLMLLVSILVAIGFTFASVDLIESLKALSRAKQIVERNELADSCLRIMNNFVAERGRALVVLNGPESMYQHHRAFINEKRAQADIELSALLDRIPHGGQNEAQQVSQLWMAFNGLRMEVDRDFLRSPAERDVKLQARWMNAANELVAWLFALQESIVEEVRHTDSGFDSLDRLRLIAWQFRTLIGAEASMFGANAQTGRPLSREEIGSIYLIRGQSKQLWVLLEPALTKLHNPQVDEILSRVQLALFRTLRPLQNKILQEAEQGRVDEPSRPIYINTSVPATKALGELGYGVSSAVKNYTDEQLRRAQWGVARSLAVMALILLTAGGIFWLLVRRFKRPLDGIVQKIDELVVSQGANVNMSDQRFVVENEFDRVEQALDLLRRTIVTNNSNERLLQEKERVISAVFSAVPQAIICVNSVGIVNLFSPGAEKMLGYTAEEIVGKCSPLIFHDLGEVERHANMLNEQLGLNMAPDVQVFMAAAMRSGVPEERDWTYIRKDGSRLTVHLSVVVFKQGGGEMLGCAVATDITERARVADRMSRYAYHDELTQLPNRRLFFDRLHMAITQARRSGKTMAVLLVDLDHFKPVNDGLGHAIGDQLLSAASAAMRLCLRETDTLSRIGGDEFAVILPHLEHVDAALLVGEKLREALASSLELPSGYKVTISGSIGVAVFPEHGDDGKRLLKAADRAMYAAKEAGRNCVCSFDDALEGNVKSTCGATMPDIRLIWQYAYRCGEERIDQEHQQLFEIANQLMGQVLGDANNPCQIAKDIRQLIDCVAEHFVYEESVLRNYMFPTVEQHVQQHKTLLARAYELFPLVEAQKLPAGDLLTFISRDLIAEHLLEEDRKFFPYLRDAMSRDQSRNVVL